MEGVAAAAAAVEAEREFDAAEAEEAAEKEKEVKAEEAAEAARRRVRTRQGSRCPTA